MRILVTNHHLQMLGGSETWTYTVSHELARRGHDVEVFTLHPGLFSESFEVPVVAEPSGRYDLALVNHNSTIGAAAAVSDRVVATCHGVIHELEQPAPGAHRYVAVSEEVQSHLAALGYDSTVIRNPIDCTRFAPVRPIRPTLRRVLSMCQGLEATELVEQVCGEIGVDCLSIRGSRSYSTPALMGEVDLVVGLGRTAVEAMATGRAVLVMDNRSYASHTMDGIVTAENVSTLAECNFSGRRYGWTPTAEIVRAALEQYRAEMGADNRAYALREHELSRQVDKYLELAAEIEGMVHP